MKKRIILALMLLTVLFTLSGCFISPDPTLDPLTITEGTIPFGTIQPLPTNTPTPKPEATPSPTPDTWQQSDQSTWEDWTQSVLPTATPRTAATAAPDAQSWQTSTNDYNAGYPVLRVGSTGADVSDLQARLYELGYYTGAIDGRYASGTQNAVMEFQTLNGLPADGIAGRQTQDLLYSTSAKSKMISASGTQAGYLLLKLGSSGLEVRKLQARLAELGYYSGGTDGIYGQTTVNAVKAFQRNNGLSGDGQAGEQTQKKLYAATAKYASSPVTTANPESVRSLELGMTGNDVYALQARLIELRYMTGVADGVFGVETQEALKAFQKNNGLTADGVAGYTTIKKINGSCKAATRVTPSPQPSRLVLREGDSGDAVFVLQARLFELGYYAGRIDGRFSEETTAAVKAFQKANGLGADGIVGSGTQKVLDSNNAVPGGDVAGSEGTEEEPQVPAQLSTLRKGDDNSEVLVLQQYLMRYGFLTTSPDGQFGSGTERAVKLFQEANGLTADGIAGPGTLSILYGSGVVSYSEYFGGSSSGSTGNTGSSSGAAAVQPTAKPNTDIVIQWESEGDDVRSYQKRLVELGYLDSKNVTGKFNQPTVLATKAFQTMNGLKVDGAAGPQSLKLIYSDEALNANGVRVGDLSSSNSGHQDAVVSEVLTAGMSGEQVRQLQSRLAQLGYLSSSFVSGTYDSATQQAVRQFQTANGLSADGAAGSATQSRLYASGAVSAQAARVTGDNSTRQNEEYRLNGAYQASIAGGGFVVSDRNNLYGADAAQGGVLVKRPFNGALPTVLSSDVPRFLHVTNNRLYYVASDGGEDCIIRMNADGTSREVLCRAGIILRFALHDGVMYYLDANATLRERTLSGEESELMGGVADFSLDVQGGVLLCVTQEGVESFGITTGNRVTLYTGNADQAAQCGKSLLVRTGGSIVRVTDGTSATIRKDGATWMGVYGQKVIQLTSRGVVTCDVNGENATTILNGAFDSAAIANGVLYVGGRSGYTQQVTL